MNTNRSRRRPARWTAALAVLAATLAVVAAAPVGRPVAHADAASRGGDFVPFTSPRTIWDTRSGAKLKANATASFNAVNVNGVPATGVSALFVRIIAVAPTANTWLSAYPHGTPLPGVSMVNVAAGETLSNSAIVRPGANGQLTVYNKAGDTHVVVEAQGYFTTSTGAANGGLVPVTQKRALDTTKTGGVIPAGGSRTVDLAAAGVPVGASAAFVNLTVPPYTGAPGFFTATATGVPAGVNGVMNYENAMYSATGSVVPLSTDTRVTFTNKGTTAVHLVVDVSAYFTKTATAGAGLRPLTARSYVGTLAAQAVVDVQVGGTNGLPTRGIAGAQLSLQASGTVRGALNAWPTGATEPGIALTQHNGAVPHRSSTIVRPGTDGKVRIKNYSAAAITLVVDLEGWFAEPQTVVPTVPDTPISLLQAIPTGQNSGTVEYAYVNNLGKVVVAHQQDPLIYQNLQYTTISGNEAFSGPAALSHAPGGTVRVSAQYGDGGDIWSSTQTASGAPTWGPFQDQGGSMAYAPAAANLTDNTNVLFAVDADGKLWAYVQTATTPYWRDLGDQDLVGTPTTAQVRDGVQVFARGAGGVVKSLVFRTDLTVTPWADLGGSGTGTVAAVTYPGYRLRVFARAADGTIVAKAQDTAGVFPANWTPLGTFAAAGDPAAIIDPVDGRTWVVARDGTGALLGAAETSPGTGAFADWNPLGNEVPSVVDPAVAPITSSGEQFWVIVYRGIQGLPRVIRVTQTFAKQTRLTEQALPAPR
jgi:hypothetical protein